MAEQIVREIWLFQKRRTPPIDIVAGSQIPIALEMKDYTIPSGATVKVYARPWGRETTYVQNAAVSGNMVVFTPQDGFFQEGWNAVQLEIDGSKIPLALDVNGGVRLSDGGGGATPEAVRPLVARAEDAAKAAVGQAAEAKASADAAENSAQGIRDSAAKIEKNAAEVNQLKEDTNIQGNSIALNRYKSDFIIEKAHGVTLTRGTKGEIIFSGTATGATYFLMDRWNGEFDGKVIFHTGVKGTLESYFAYVQEADEYLNDRFSSDWKTVGADYGNGVSYTESKEKYYQMIIAIRSGVNVDGVVMYPMLETGSHASEYTENIAAVNIMGGARYSGVRINEFLHNINNALGEIDKRCLISKDSVINKESAKVIKGLKNINPNRLYYVNGDITEDDFEGLPVYKRIGILSALSPFVNAATQNLGKIYIYAIAEKMWYKMHLYDEVWGDWVEIAAPKVYDIRYTKYYKPSILFEPGISYDWVDSSGNHDDFTAETTSEEYFAKLNALADSWYELKKENLGKDASGKFDIYGYRLHCFEPPIPGGLFQHKPKIIITGCHHGFEKCAAFSLYYLMKHLKNDWRTNKTLEYLRYACDICFIPIVNTWGFTNYVEGDGAEHDNPITRLNSNGVDLNRGYNSDSLQPEQIIVKSFTSRYKDDAILFVDYHTNGSTRTESKRSVKNWISLRTYGEKTLEDISIYDQSVIGRHFSSTYGNGSDQNWGTITQGIDEGLASWLGDSMNIPSLTLEGTFYVDNDTEEHEFNPTVNKFNAECLINFLGLALKKYSNLY